MTTPEFSAHLSYAAVDDGEGGDPRPRARALLRELRVLSALRDPEAPWADAGSEAVVQIAVSGDGFVLTLTERGEITRAVRVPALRERFADEGMTLWLEDPAEDSAEAPHYAGDLDDDPTEGFESDDDDELADAELAALYDVPPVQVYEFSRRGPLAARALAAAAKTDVDYVEDGSWSMLAYHSHEPSPLWPPSKVEAPILALNIPADGEVWIEVTTHGGFATTVPFWPNIERATEPVLDIDDIAVPEAAATYRMLLTEGDGSLDELDEIAARVPVDVDAAHAALIAEALGGVVGAEARIRSFLHAFGVPEALLDQALAASLVAAQRFEAKRWLPTLGDMVVGGSYEAAALPSRDRLWVRLARHVRENPVLGFALAAAELAAGLGIAARARGGWRALGWALMVDAVGEVVVALIRLRRR